MKALTFALLFTCFTFAQAGPCVPAGQARTSKAATVKKSAKKEGLQPDGSRIVGRAELDRSHTVADALRRHSEISVSRW